MSHTASPEDPEVWLPPSRQPSFTRTPVASDDEGGARVALRRPFSSEAGLLGQPWPMTLLMPGLPTHFWASAGHVRSLLHCLACGFLYETVANVAWTTCLHACYAARTGHVYPSTAIRAWFTQAGSSLRRPSSGTKAVGPKVDSWRWPKDRPPARVSMTLEERLLGGPSANSSPLAAAARRYKGPDPELAAALERCAQATADFGHAA